MGLNYTYDNIGNVLKINNENYTYNSMNELNSSSGPWGTTSYSYDGEGNMLNMTVGSTTTKYGYDSYNRMTSAGSSSLTYDPNGNLNKIVNGSTTWKYYYDDLNLLDGVSKNGVDVQNSTYNFDTGNRVEQTVGSSSIVYTYQGSNILFQENLTSKVMTKNYYANGLLVGESIGGTRYYLIDDLLGSIRDVTTSTASSVFSSNYKPYGASYDLTLSLPDTFYYYYTHKPYDPSTGLYYYGARYYDPGINRFISEDTTKGSLTDPISLNRYTYARNNPEAIVDLDGHGWWSSLTNAVSSIVSNVVSTAVSNIVSIATNPETQAVTLTVGVDALAVGAVALDVGTGGLASTLTSAAIGAAISTTSYTISTWGHSTLDGAAEAAGSGALIGAATFGFGELAGGAGNAIDSVASELQAQGIDRVGIIGESMEDRVIPFAQQLQERGITAEVFRPPSGLTDEAELTQRNLEWINQLKSSNTPIVDIGPSVLKGNYPGITSTFYENELGWTKGYSGYMNYWGGWLLR